ncbi:MAG: hypothetical protein ABL958_10940 [Bdellovibrionia bacterium]
MSHGQDNQRRDKITGSEAQRIAAAAFASARQMDLQPSPYMKTRILAELRDRKSRTQSVSLWKRVAVACSAMAAVALIWTSMSKSTAFEAVVNQPYVVKVEMAELQKELIATAEIALPDGVTFYSENYPELREKRNLELAWNGDLKQAVLPFVINGGHKGLKEVKVRFFSADKKVVAERVLKIDFRTPQG